SRTSRVAIPPRIRHSPQTRPLGGGHSLPGPPPRGQRPLYLGRQLYPAESSPHRLARMRGKWWTLVGACFGLFLLMLDSTVVSLALPRIRGDVGASDEQLQWMLNVYLLTISVLVVTAGRLGDMFGRKRVFLAGMVLFGLGSIVSGLAGDPDTLILGRVLQGIGGAPMLALSLAIVCNAFPAEEVPKALGIWA